MIQVGAWGGLALLLICLIPFLRELFGTLLGLVICPIVILISKCSVLINSALSSHPSLKNRCDKIVNRYKQSFPDIMAGIVTVIMIAAFAFLISWIIYITA